MLRKAPEIKLSDAEKAQLENTARRSDTLGLPDIGGAIECQPSGRMASPQKRKLHLRRARSWGTSTDPEFTEKAADIVGLYLIIALSLWPALSFGYQCEMATAPSRP